MAISLTMTVPSGVPLVIQTSRPTAVVAAKMIRPSSSAVIPSGLEPAAAGLMSFSRRVPVVVPSVTQSSEPKLSIAAKTV